MDGVSATHQPSYLERIWMLRFFLFSLVRMDLRNRYKRSMLGVGWSLVRPLAMTGVICLIFCRLFNMNVREYGPFLLCGFTVWGFIVESATMGCITFTMGAAYIRQQPVPLAIFPLRTVMGSAFHGLVAFLLTVVLIFFLNGPIAPECLLVLVPTLILLFVFAWALALVCGLIHTHFPDTQYLIEILFQILFYMTPVIYPPEMIRARTEFAWFIEINPLTYLLEAIRIPLLHGQLVPWHVYAVCLGTVAGLFWLSTKLLQRMEKHLVFWL